MPQRCLIVERHPWETGFDQEQIQIPLAAAASFFGAGTAARTIRVRISGSPRPFSCQVSAVLRSSHTRRIMNLPIVGLLGPCFVFLQETRTRGLYDMWCQYDMPIVVAAFPNWSKGRNNQYRRGRLVNIVPAPVARPIRDI